MKQSIFLLLALAGISSLFISCEEDSQRVFNCIDYDGNKYENVVIGDQIWMAENLKAIHSTDGGKNYLTAELANWVNKDVERRFLLNNDTIYRNIYGYMYNYRAIENGKLAPNRWRIPSKADWEKLFAYIKAHTFSYEPSAASDWVAKALASKSVWNTSSLVGSVGNVLSTNNATGFNALPGGYRLANGNYTGEKNRACFWTSTIDSVSNRPLVVYIDCNSIEFQVDTFMTNEEACYVRCVRDVPED